MSAKVSPGIWWLHPAVALGCPATIALVAAYLISPNEYALYWRTPKFIDGHYLVIGLACVLAFCAGAVAFPARNAASQRPENWRESIPWNRVRVVFNLSFWLCVIGYAVWIGVGIKNGLTFSVIAEELTSSSGVFYDVHFQYLATVPGLTTLTQFGIAAVALGIPLAIVSGWTGLRWKLVLIFVLSICRASIYSERLAMIELVVPALVSFLFLKIVVKPPPVRVRRLIAAAPFVGCGVLYLLFGAFEYSRSWLAFYAARESSFWRFMGLRLIGYYATALNNGALLCQSIIHPLGAYDTAKFAWRFPIIKEILESAFPRVAQSGDFYDNLLTSSANLEFNNGSGLFMPVTDFGTFGGICYWLVCGAICGALYRQFQRCTTAGVFLYPMIFTGMIEAARILYWADGRFFPPIFIVFISVVFFFYVPSRNSANSALQSAHPLAQ